MNNYAVLNMKNGDVFYYKRNTPELYLSLEQDFINKNHGYIGLHKLYENMSNQEEESFFSMFMESVDFIEYVGVRFIPGSNGETTAIFV